MQRIIPCNDAMPPGVESPCTESYDCLCHEFAASLIYDFERYPYAGIDCPLPYDGGLIALVRIRLGWGAPTRRLRKRADAFGGLAGYQFECAEGADLLTATTTAVRFVVAPIVAAGPLSSGLFFTRGELFRELCPVPMWGSGSPEDIAARAALATKKLRIVAIGSEGRRIAVCEIGLSPVPDKHD